MFQIGSKLQFNILNKFKSICAFSSKISNKTSSIRTFYTSHRWLEDEKIIHLEINQQSLLPTSHRWLD